MKSDSYSCLYHPDKKEQTELFDNRSFRYGDGFFETMSMFQNRLILFDSHIKRLNKTADLLRIETNANFYNAFHEAVSEIPFSNARIRLTVFRTGDGNYKPESSAAGFYLNAVQRNESNFVLNAKGLSIVSFKEHLKPITPLQALKTNNSLLYVLASQYAKSLSKDDALIFNDKKRICETTRGNLFLVSGKKLITPPVSEGGINGVMRDFVTELAENIGLSLTEVKLTEEDIANADEVWQSNAVHGIQWYVAWEKNRYFSKYARKMISALNERLVNLS